MTPEDDESPVDPVSEVVAQASHRAAVAGWAQQMILDGFEVKVSAGRDESGKPYIHGLAY